MTTTATRIKMTPLRRRRLIVLVTAVVLLAGVGTAMVLHAAARADRADRPQAGGPTISAGRLTLDQKSRLTFVNGAAGPHRTAVASVASADPGGKRIASDVKCARFYAAAGTGVCLQSTTGVLKQSNRALLLDANLRTRHTYPLAGTPSRARVSPSGRRLSIVEAASSPHRSPRARAARSAKAASVAATNGHTSARLSCSTGVRLSD